MPNFFYYYSWLHQVANTKMETYDKHNTTTTESSQNNMVFFF